MLIDSPRLRKKHGEAGRKWARNNVGLKNLREALIDDLLYMGVN